MYGLKGDGIIAFLRLVKNLTPYRYSHIQYTPELWRYEKDKTTFTLCVEDFSMKYFIQHDAPYLVSSIKANYECTLY